MYDGIDNVGINSCRFLQKGFLIGTGLSRGGDLGRGRLKCPHFDHSLDQSDIDFAGNFGKLQKLSMSE